jgi:hypothetical protein
MVVVKCEAQLLDFVLTGRSSGGFTRLLDGGQQQSDEDRDDGNHDQQLNERKATMGLRGKFHECSPIN